MNRQYMIYMIILCYRDLDKTEISNNQINRILILIKVRGVRNNRILHNRLLITHLKMIKRTNGG